MKKKHYIKDISDIKYCEEKGLKLFSEDDSHYFKFERGCWNEFEGRKLWLYHAAIDPTDVYYYEEEAEEQQEASEKDVGKLCFGWNYDNEVKDLGILKAYDASDDHKYHIVGLGYYEHCRPLTKEEIKEFMEKAE